MTERVYVRESLLPGTPRDVWDFHEEPGTFELFLPPFERSQILLHPQGLKVGSEVRVRSWIGPVPIRIVAMIRRADAPKIFIDEMIQGPFSYWQHRHEFEDGPISGTTLYRDTVIYCVPLGLLGDTIHPWLVYPRLAQVFDYRHQVAFREMRRRIVK